MNKLIVILGPTASGKTELAIKLARFYHGEIISADSRQVYKGMNIGTGKVPRDRPNNERTLRPNDERIKTNKKRIFDFNSVSFVKDSDDTRRIKTNTEQILDSNSLSFDKNSSEYLYRGVPHHLLDVVSPKTRFTVAHYQKMALKKINEILQKNKLPMLVGGTGFYIQAITDGIVIPHVKPNWQLRKKLEKKSVIQLFQMLKKLDPQRAKTIERKNPRRLIRALEIIFTTKKPVAPIQRNPLPYKILILGVKKSKEELKKLIQKRLIKRLKHGMIEEVKKLRKNGLSWKRLEEFGLEYRWLSYFLQNKISHQEMIDKLQHAIEQFARRQMTWFKRDKRIKWIKDFQKAKKTISNFLKPELETKYGLKSKIL